MTRGHKKKKSQLLLYVAISMGLHMIFLALRLQNSDLTDSVPAAPSVIELSDFKSLPNIPPSSAMKQVEQPRDQVVESEDAGNREIDPNAHMWSDKNQKAQQQTRAGVVDDFKKGGGKGPQNSPESSTEEAAAEESDEISLGTAKKSKTDWKKLSLKDLSVSGGDGNPLSASDDYLPNVASGERTILSTREFRYFSYYNRIKDLLRQHWKPRIEREVAKLWGKGQMLKENELTTRVLVLLDKTGQVQKISKVGASGVHEIDEVAVQAFHEAAPFPNPPSGLIDSDGFVRINWDFILQTAAAPAITYSPGGFRPRR